MVGNKRNTVQRQLVLNAVKELNSHSTADQIFEYVAKIHPSISKATVYRNLNLLVESNELLNIGIFQGSARYDHNCHGHYHFMCEGCNKVFDVEGNFSDIIHRVGETDGFNVSSYYLSFSGLCKECQRL